MAKHNKNKHEAKDESPKDMKPNTQNETTVNDVPEGKIPENKEEETESLNQKYNEINDKYLRLYSDFDNYRKRVIKEKIEMSKTASEDLITNLLGTLDDFERALGAMENSEEDPTRQGILLIYNKFRSLLTQKGLAEIEAMGKPFDTDFHEAIANIPAPSKDQTNTILDVAQKGYTLNGKVIRFARVVVGI
ncbi:MAG: nucleotide exchange factor GrpE [Lentimicrobium sp.]|jgi:molecular chaperone GrpE|nr:nucleotide exchange factor GrpE [Lentimicrobium sp.]